MMLVTKFKSYQQKIAHVFMCTVFMLLAACSTTNTPSDNTPNLKQAAQTNAQLGLGYLQEGNTQRAKEKLLLAMQQDPHSPAVLNAMALFLQATGDSAGAAKTYQQALTLAPHAGETLNNYGVYLCQQKQPQQAITYFKQAIQAPNYVDTAKAYENAGLCALEIPDNAQASTFFTQALENDPSLPTATLEMAKLAYIKHDMTSAQFYLNRYNQLAKPTVESLLLTVNLAKQQGNAVLANDAAQELVTRFPHSQLFKQGNNA